MGHKDGQMEGLHDRGEGPMADGVADGVADGMACVEMRESIALCAIMLMMAASARNFCCRRLAERYLAPPVDVGLV